MDKLWIFWMNVRRVIHNLLLTSSIISNCISKLYHHQLNYKSFLSAKAIRDNTWTILCEYILPSILWKVNLTFFQTLTGYEPKPLSCAYRRYTRSLLNIASTHWVCVITDIVRCTTTFVIAIIRVIWIAVIVTKSLHHHLSSSIASFCEKSPVTLLCITQCITGIISKVLWIKEGASNPFIHRLLSVSDRFHSPLSLPVW